MPRSPTTYATVIQKVQNVADAVREAQAAACAAEDTDIFHRLHDLRLAAVDLSVLAMRRGVESASGPATKSG